MKEYYVLKKDIIAKNLNNGFDEIILPKNSVVEFRQRYIRYKGGVNNGIRNIYSTYRYKSLVAEYKLDRKIFKLKSYEFTINDKFLCDYLDINYDIKNTLLIDLNSKIHKIFQEKVS